MSQNRKALHKTFLESRHTFRQQCDNGKCKLVRDMQAAFSPIITPHNIQTVPHQQDLSTQKNADKRCTKYGNPEISSTTQS